MVDLVTALMAIAMFMAILLVVLMMIDIAMEIIKGWLGRR